jgi:hypothetical protein
MDKMKKIISNGQGYFTYLKELNKPISIKELAYEEVIQLLWREEISAGLIAWLTNEPVKSVTNTIKQKHLIEVKELDITEKGICTHLNEQLFWSLGANLTKEQIKQITKNEMRLLTHLKMKKSKNPSFNIYFLNREMFNQLWWREGITDKQLGEELVGINERRIREIRTEWYKVTYPFVNNKEKEIDKFLN